MHLLSIPFRHSAIDIAQAKITGQKLPTSVCGHVRNFALKELEPFWAYMFIYVFGALSWAIFGIITDSDFLLNAASPVCMCFSFLYVEVRGGFFSKRIAGR